MDNPRAEKVAVVDEVRKRFDGADAAILTEYRGLKVKDLAVLRRGLRKDGGEYRIYKNTLVRFATHSLGLEALDPMLEGPTAIAFVRGDPAAVAKTLRDFGRTNQLLVIKGGVLGEKILDAGDTAALADLPSREVLLARVAGSLAAPLQQFAGLLAALPRNLAYGLAALRDKKAEEAGTASEDAGPVAAAEPEVAAAEPEVTAEAEAAEREAEPEPAAGDGAEPPAAAPEPAVAAGPEAAPDPPADPATAG